MSKAQKKPIITLSDDQTSGAVGYVDILDAIIAAIQEGTARPGERLPTQRELAQRFGVALGTVTRAYAEATRLGYLRSTVGRGTFVVGNPPIHVSRQTGPLQCFDMMISRPPAEGCRAELASALGQLQHRGELGDLLQHQPIAGRQEHRLAGAELIHRAGYQVDVDNVVLCNGVQHGLVAVLGARASAGDLVVTECLNYPGIRMAAKLFNLRLKGLEIDEEGLVPDAFEAVCRSDNPKVLFCTPTLHNPTSAIMGRERRKAIAEIADRYGVIVIEDDICGLMPERPHVPIASLIPQRTYYLTGASKCLSAGVRVGYIVAPNEVVDEVVGAVQATTWIASPLMAAVVTIWVNDGTIDRILAWNRAETRARQALASEALKQFQFSSHPAAFHLWVQLPEPWRRSEFELQARKRGLIIPSSETFVMGRGDTHSVRIGLGVADRTTLAAGLERLAKLISDGPQAEPITI